MEIRVRLFVQQHASSAFTAKVLDLPHLSGYGSTREAAVASVEQKVRGYLANVHADVLGRFASVDEQRLLPLEIDLTPRDEPDARPIAISVSLLVTTQARPRGRRFVITAPRIANLHVVANDPGDIESRARTAIAQLAQRWGARAIVGADREGEESLETLTISLPESAPPRPAAELSNTSDQQDVLTLCGVNLTDQAGRGMLPPVERRDAVLDQLIQVISSERASSVILVGPGDVGKTALVHEVARRIHAGTVPESLRGREVWFITASNLIAGMKYTGEWQSRTQRLVAQARKGKHILFMADPGQIVTEARWSGSDNNIGRFLRPYVESGEITIVCECSQEGYEAALRLEPGFVNACRRIDVSETDAADTLAIVQATARRLEQSHGMRIDPSAVRAVLDLTRRFLPYRSFPGKAVRVLETIVRDRASAQDDPARSAAFGREQAVAGFARMTGLPTLLLSDEERLRVDEVRMFFEERLLGQQAAVAAMVDLVTVLKAGLNDPHKPLGSFFFVGPTGVGKTEMAKVLAEFLFGSRDRMVRFDMSEYASADALPRLIGSAWQPEGHGELTRRVREQPFSVVLLDEMEKTSGAVIDALLAVLGEGRLTDARGQTTSFLNAIIIMTSNLGASRRAMQSMGFGAGAGSEDADAWLTSHFVKEAERFFRPEFFNRIDRIVPFGPLSRASMALITRRELGKLLMREGVVRRNVLVEIDDAVIDELLDQGFHPLYGARPLQRAIERLVIVPLARLLVERSVGEGNLLRFAVRGGEIRLELTSLEPDEETKVEGAPGPAAATHRWSSDLATALRSLEETRQNLSAERSGVATQLLREELTALLARTHEPTFWDEPEGSRRTLTRVYHVDRLLKRLDALEERAERLEEKGRQVRLHRDRLGAAELVDETDALASDASFLRVEIVGASSGATGDAALLLITPVGRDGDPWAGRLAGMYAAWARRVGHECRTLEPVHGNLPARTESARQGATRVALVIKGSGIHELLAGEAGLHKLDDGTAAERRRALARVAVLPCEDNLALDDKAALDAAIPRALASLDGAPPARESSLARVYVDGKHHFVRDPRTGTRRGSLRAVLDEGQIDDFLMSAWSARQEAQREPEPSSAR